MDDELRVTVKRAPGGTVSNWMHDHLAPGSVVEVARPAGFFRLGAEDGDVVAFSAGSGITPVLSLMKTALATTARRVRLLYANQDHDAVIFRSELDALVRRYGERCTVRHHLDVDHGLVGPDAVRAFAEGADGRRVLRVRARHRSWTWWSAPCSPTGVDRRPDPHRAVHPRCVGAGAGDRRRRPAATATRITIELDGRTASTEHYPGTTILQTARQLEYGPAVLVRSGELCHLHGQAAGGDGLDAGQQRAHRRRGGRRLGAHLPGAAHRSHGAGGLRLRGGVMEQLPVDDVIELQQLLARYAVGMTRDDVEAVMEVFTPDGTYSAFGDTYPLADFPDPGGGRAQGAVPGGAAGARARRGRGHRTAAPVLRRPDDPRHAHRLLHRHLPPHRRRLAAAAPGR